MATRREVLSLIAASGAAGCARTGGGGGDADTETEARGTTGTGRGTTATTGTDAEFQFGSPAFADGESIPPKYTVDGEDVSPSLSVDGVPRETRSLALVMDDPDAPDGAFVHWLLWGLSPEVNEIPEGVKRAGEVEGLDARQGTNGFGAVGYRGPAPPEGDDPHRYRFTLHALDETVDVGAGARRPALEEAMEGTVTSTARLTGTYQRS